VVPLLPDAIYREDALIQILNLPREALRRARRDGLLRYSRPGKTPLYRGSWVISWLEAQSVSTREGGPGHVA
jgi:hypothetical protein